MALEQQFLSHNISNMLHICLNGQLGFSIVFNKTTTNKYEQSFLGESATTFTFPTQTTEISAVNFITAGLSRMFDPRISEITNKAHNDQEYQQLQSCSCHSLLKQFFPIQNIFLALFVSLSISPFHFMCRIFTFFD